MNQNRPLLIHCLHTFDGGGTERALAKLISALAGGPYDQMVVTLRKAGALSALLPNSVACRPIQAVGRTITAGNSLARIAKKATATVIHARNTCTWFDATVAHLRCRSSKLVLGFHGLDDQADMGVIRNLKTRLAITSGAKFTTVAQSGKIQLIEQAKVPEDSITVLPNGIDLTRFSAIEKSRRTETREAFGIPENSRVIGTAGTLSAVKRIDLLLQAFANVASHQSTWRLVIAGDGPQREELEKLALHLEIADRVIFTEWCDNMPKLLSCMDVYACSSDSEGMSNSILEAMAASLPIVATNVGDNGLLLKNGECGMLVQSGSIESLSSAISQLALHSDLCEELAVAALRRANDFTFDKMVAAYDQYYRTLMNLPRNLAVKESPAMATCAPNEALKNAPQVDDTKLADVVSP